MKLFANPRCPARKMTINFNIMLMLIVHFLLKCSLGLPSYLIYFLLCFRVLFIEAFTLTVDNVLLKCEMPDSINLVDASWLISQRKGGGNGKKKHTHTTKRRERFEMYFYIFLQKGWSTGTTFNTHSTNVLNYSN